MGARRSVVIGSMLLASTAGAEQTLQPSKVTLTVPQGWEVMSERDGDFLHFDSSEDSEPRTIDRSRSIAG